MNGATMSQIPQSTSNQAAPVEGAAIATMVHDAAMSKMPRTMSFAVQASFGMTVLNANGAMTSHTPSTMLIQLMFFMGEPPVPNISDRCKIRADELVNVC